MSIKNKLTMGLFLCSLVPLFLVATACYVSSTSGLQAVSERAAHDMESKAAGLLTSQQEIKTKQVEAYFAQIRDQILTFSENRMVVEGMRHFPKAFDNFREEAGIADAEINALKEELTNYYTDEFGVEYASQNDGKDTVVDDLIAPLDDDSIALQHTYISKNEHPLGSKHLLDAGDTETSYDRLHEVVHPVVRSYLEKFGYYDIFLIEPETGDIVYSVFKELDYSTSLKNGPYADTNFADAFRKANELPAGEFVLVDFKQYKPSYEAPASFIAAPIFDGEEKLGVAIFQMPVDNILELMSHRVSLGDTGECLLIGGDKLPRSDSHLDPENRGLVNAFRNANQGMVEMESVDFAIKGESGIHTTTDYLGNEVLAAYGPVDILGNRWALIAKMNTEEAFATVTEMQGVSDRSTRNVLWSSVGISVISLVAISLVTWYMVHSIVGPLHTLVSRVHDISNGEADLTRRIEINSKDELGDLASGINLFIERVQKIISKISASCSDLTIASSQLGTTSKALTDGVSQTELQSSTANDNAEKMSSTMNSMAASSEQMTANFHSVASATEEMKSTITEIARNAEQSAQVAGHAYELASTSDEKISGLGDAAEEIGKVTEVIQNIAEQTNLLALNATIEAARAGEAGKGFSVVAAEVKDLAQQTAEATEDIRSRINGIQSTAGEAVTSIKEITSVINDVNDVSRTIAAAVEEQSITTKDIAQNVNQVSSAVEVVASGIKESAQASHEINVSINSVEGVAKKTAGAANEAKSSGERVDELSRSIRDLVSEFRV